MQIIIRNLRQSPIDTQRRLGRVLNGGAALADQPNHGTDFSDRLRVFFRELDAVSLAKTQANHEFEQRFARRQENQLLAQSQSPPAHFVVSSADTAVFVHDARFDARAFDDRENIQRQTLAWEQLEKLGKLGRAGLIMVAFVAVIVVVIIGRRA